MYRKDSLIELKEDLSNINFKSGVKLVRGAYWNTDKILNNLYIEKEQTDNNYNMGILELNENNKDGYNLLATHNKDSLYIGKLLNYKNGEKIFEFAHLLGMNSKIFNEFVKSGEIVNVYIPYGPYKYMFPYLSRRLYENLDMIKYMYL